MSNPTNTNESSVPMELDDENKTANNASEITENSETDKQKKDNDVEMKGQTNNNNEEESNEASAQSRAEKLKILREKLKKLRDVVVIGCGNWRCLNPYCHSNLKNKDSEYNDRDASLKAKEMFQQKLDPENACEQFGLLKIMPLTRDSVEALKDETECSEDSDEYKKCLATVTTAMEHWDILEVSFLIKNKKFNKNTKQPSGKSSSETNTSTKNNSNDTNMSSDNNNNNKTNNDATKDTTKNDKKQENNDLSLTSNDKKNDKKNDSKNDDKDNEYMKPDTVHAQINFIELDAVFRIIRERDSVAEAARSALKKGLQYNTDHPNSSLTMSQLRCFLILLECPLCLSDDPTDYDMLSQLLAMIDNLNPRNHKILAKWLSTYDDVFRLKNMLDLLQQYLTIKIVECEEVIEDKTTQWEKELGYDEEGDPEEQEEIVTKIRTNQQKYRRERITDTFSIAVRVIDLFFQANQMITKASAKINDDQKESPLSPTASSSSLSDSDNDDKNDMDIIINNASKAGNNNNNKEEKEEKKEEKKSDENVKIERPPLKTRRVSLVGVSKSKHPLPLALFHNSGLNETICSHDIQRRLIHRYDFSHWRDKDFFSFMQYPYLLDAGSKAKYLEFENLILQSDARRQRLFEVMLGNGAGGMGGLLGLLSGAPQRLNRDQVLEMDLTLRVHRNRLIQDTLPQLSLLQSPGDFRRRLRIIFDGEEGIDQGGLTKEYFQLIMEELFDINFGMFVYNKETGNYWFNKDSFESQSEFKLVGILMGIAVYNNTILDLNFPKALYKKMLDLKCDFNDFRDFDPTMAHGFEELLAYEQDLTDKNSMSIEDMFGYQTFTIEYEFFGTKRVVELKPNGKDIILNSENRQEYVDLYIDYILNESIAKQFNSFYQGWKLVCNSKLFSKDRFNADELELLICGSKEFDFEALQQTVKYDDGFDKKSQTIKDFWDIACNELTHENQKKLLSFITGSDRVPIRGLADVPLTISKNGNDDKQLPTSHTCFNHLLLPEYSSKEILKQRLVTAINNAKGFGLL